MCLMEELPSFKERILEHVKKAAQNADIEAIAKWSKAAEQCETFIRETTELESRVRDFADSFWPKPGNNSTNQAKKLISNQKPPKKTKISAKKEGAMVREKWLKELSSKGITLKGHDKRYFTEVGRSVSIAFANELDRPQLVNKWFLGLKDESTDIAVLLCKDKEGNMHEIIIPVSKMGFTWGALSRSRGQVKFHIQRRREEFLLSIPGGNPENITRYISNYEALNELVS